MAKAFRDVAIGATAIPAADHQAAPIKEAIASIANQMPMLERSALLEMLALEAPLLRHTAELHYAQSVRCFAITIALAMLVPKTGGDSCGAGLESHLQMPTPTHPSYKFVSVPRLYLDVAEEAQRILQELRA